MSFDRDRERRHKVTFTGNQLLAFQGNRYSQEDMLEVINLYLTRNSYRAFREILVLPPMCHYCV